MTISKDQAAKIYTAFDQMMRTGDKASIEDIPLEDLKMTLVFYHKDEGWPAYKLIQQRIGELEKIEDQARAELKRIEDRRISRWEKLGFLLLGCILTLIGQYIFHQITKP